MFSSISEKVMHRVRWVLTVGWLLLIASLFYDPFSGWLTDPRNSWSPLRLDPKICVKVQGVCLSEQPYPLGAPLFWGIIVPSAIFILLVFGHELWRRICPLSFLSQVAVALKLQRQIKRVDPKSGKVRFEIVKIKKDSWLGRNYLYFQFGWLFVGLCARILFINSNRLALAIWLIFTIMFAITVGYLYGGKTWCQYFCPMAPVQKIYAEPGGLLTSPAYSSGRLITQSMCRSIREDGQEQSACVACKSPCIDIDSERAYWDSVNQADHRVLYYGYVGLVIGYFGYYYLYAGNWYYYFSGAWAHQENQLDGLLKPGFYIFEQVIPIPKIIAVPLTLGLSSFLVYQIGRWVEKYLRGSFKKLSKEVIQHRIFTIATYVIFNFFFIFGGRPFVILMPIWMQYLYESILVILSTLWVYQTWRKTPDLYGRESLASKLRKQLRNLELELSKYLDNRSIDDLDSQEVYILAKVLPNFTKEKRYQAYKGVLREALEEGYVNTASSLEVLTQIRGQLDISEQEHRRILTELGIEDPELLNPSRLRTKENLVRLTGYRKALERVMSLQQEPESDSFKSGDYQGTLKMLRKEFSITAVEEAEILSSLNPEVCLVRRAELLIEELRNLTERFRALHQPMLQKVGLALQLLFVTVKQKKRIIVTALLEIISGLSNQEEALRLAILLEELSPMALLEILEEEADIWRGRLSADIFRLLQEPSQIASACQLDVSKDDIIYHLEELFKDINPVIQALSLYVLYQLDQYKGIQLANCSWFPNQNLLVQDTADIILRNKSRLLNLADFEKLEKLVIMSSSSFFSGVSSETLIMLGDRAIIKTYQPGDIVTEEGDTCRELLLLISGKAQVELMQTDGELKITDLRPGEVLDELEVLTHTVQPGTIRSQGDSTRILAIGVDTFDEILDRDHYFARKVLELESLRLQQLLR